MVRMVLHSSVDDGLRRRPLRSLRHGTDLMTMLQKFGGVTFPERQYHGTTACCSSASPQQRSTLVVPSSDIHSFFSFSITSFHRADPIWLFSTPCIRRQKPTSFSPDYPPWQTPSRSNSTVHSTYRNTVLASVRPRAYPAMLSRGMKSMFGSECSILA